MKYSKRISLICYILLHTIYDVHGSKDKLKFVILGDIGGIPTTPYSMWSQRLVSRQISKIPNVDFFAVTGDNFYYRGVKNVDDFRFRATFENVYNAASLQRDWYIIAGNHDYDGNVSAQILYSKKSGRWKFPHFYHSKVFNIGITNKTLQLVMIDTTSLCYRSVGKRKNAPPPETQMQWIIETLKKSTADYLIFIGHHPLYSAGRHGNTQCLHDKLLELLKEYKVNAYISGHDHNLQHIIPRGSSLQHFVCGSSNFYSNWKPSLSNLEPNSLKMFAGKKPGYIIVTARKRNLKFELRTTERRDTYITFLSPRSKLPDYIRKQQSTLLENFLKSF